MNFYRIFLIYICTSLLFTKAAMCNDRAFSKLTGIESSYKLTLLSDRVDFGPWHDGGIGFYSLLKGTPLIFSAAYQYRLYPKSHVNDMQLILDIWPELHRFLYANINAGWSPSISVETIYPDFHLHAELYFTGFRMTELSLGTKVSFYETMTPVLITGSYHFITEKESITARLFCIPYHGGSDASIALQYRHTFTTAGFSVGAGIGGGTSSEATERATLHDLWSYHCKLESRIKLKNGWKFTLLPVLYYEEYSKDKYWKKFELELKVLKSWN